MKKGDILAKDTTLEIGEIVYHGCSSIEQANNYMNSSFLSEYKILPQYEVKTDPLNPNLLAIFLLSPVIKHEEATINWVMDNEVAVSNKTTGFCSILDMNEDSNKSWKVIFEALPTYQSSVADLTDEELRQSIENLRSQRKPLADKVRKIREVTTPKVDKSDPIAVALANLPADKKEALMRKLGMI
jgi:hypothetical protein